LINIYKNKKNKVLKTQVAGLIYRINNKFLKINTFNKGL
jgi:hypothetical protein